MSLENYESRDSEKREAGMSQMDAEILQLKESRNLELQELKQTLNRDFNSVAEGILPRPQDREWHAADFDDVEDFEFMA